MHKWTQTNEACLQNGDSVTGSKAWHGEEWVSSLNKMQILLVLYIESQSSGILIILNIIIMCYLWDVIRQVSLKTLQSCCDSGNNVIVYSVLFTHDYLL